MEFWNDKQVLVTGGAGFIASHLVEELIKKNARVRVSDNLSRGILQNLESSLRNVEFVDTDLMIPKNCEESCKDVDMVFNLAAKVAGVGYNITHPAEMFYKNSVITSNMLEAARKKNVDGFMVISSACVYSRFSTIPTHEDDGFIKDPEPTNFGYGWAKRLAEIQAKTYHQEYGMNIGIIRPYNAYGPRDYFNLEEGHVIPVLIKKVIEKWNPLVVWGDGEQSRSFIYVEDIVNGLILGAEKYLVPDPINIGNDEEIKIKDLISLIISISGNNINVQFDKNKPSGQPRRCPDIQKAKKILDFEPKISLKEGLTKTLKWHIT